MSARAAPSGSSRYVSEVELFPYMARFVEQQESTLAVQQQLIEQGNTIIKQLKEIVCGPGFIKENESKESDEEPPLRLPAETITRRLKLYRAALNGDWAVAKEIYDEDDREIGVEITNHRSTALHVAAEANRIDFVKKLLKRMSAEDLAKQNKIGCTALFYAAASGSVELAKETMKDNRNIATLPDKDGMLPIVRAASLGKEEMVVFLYEQTKDLLTDDDCIELLVQLIETDLYAVALDLLRDHRYLATKRAKKKENEANKEGETALHVLARKNLTSSNQNHRGTFQRYFNLGAKDRKMRKQRN